MVLEKFFPPRWKHKNPQVRKRALLMLDPRQEESQKIYMEVLSNDPELYIRRIAIKGLSNINQLQDLRETVNDNEIYQEATNRLCELLANCNKHRPIGFLKNVLTGISENRILEYVAIHANDEELQLLAMNNVANESILFEILNSTKFDNNKKHALAKLQTANSLKRAIKILKRKDKQLETQAQDMLDKLQEKSKQAAELQKEYRRTVNEFLELFNLCKFSGEWQKYEPRLRELSDRCHGLINRAGGQPADGDTAILHEVEQAFIHVEQQLQDINSKESQRPDWDSAAVTVEPVQRPAEFDQLAQVVSKLNELNAKIARIKLEESNVAEDECLRSLSSFKDEWSSTISKIDEDHLTEAVQTELAELRGSFTKAEKLFGQYMAHIEQARSYVSGIESINAQAKLLIEDKEMLDLGMANKLINSYKANRKPENPFIPEKIDDASRDLCEALTHKHKQTELYIEELCREFEELTARLEGVLVNGKAKSIDQLINRGRNILKQLPGKYLSRLEKKGLPKMFNQLVRRADSLLDWREWSTSAVKDKLIEEMEKLALETGEHSDDSNYDFSAAAAEISRARASWKQASKGTKDKEFSLWEKFDAACNKAYEPCQMHFNRLEESRSKNLQEREQICQDLQKYFDTVTEEEPEEIDWKVLEKIIRVAREDWEKLGVVNRNDRQVINKRFHGVLHKLEKLVRNRRVENKSAKQALINRVEVALKQLEEKTIDLGNAIDIVKNAQNQWKATGPASKDQQRWRKFKAACDSVFAARKLEQNKIRQEEAVVNKQRDEIVSRINHCSEQQGMAIFQARNEVEELQSNWRELPNLNKSHKQERLFKDACENFKEKLGQYQRAQLKAVKQQVQENVACCYQIEDLIRDCLQGQLGPGELADSVMKISEKWNMVNEKSLSYTGAIEERFQILKKYVDNIVGGQEEEFKRVLVEQHEKCLANKEALCIQLEILANKESPEGSKQKRMEIQVARLANNMKQSGKPDLVHEVQQLLSQWHTSGFILPSESRQYERRFYSALELLDKDYQYPL
jgi:predicted  nucleic acid-binding Zn-ribbon protein